MSAPAWEPLPASGRYAALDLLRGFALFGVLLVNLLYFFRVSLFERILLFHTHAGWANHAVDNLVTTLVEFKAFDLFSLTFGMGMAVQAERARQRGVRLEAFLVRRFLVLLAIGAAHLVLVSNVDILALYALCGLALIPLLRLPTVVLAVAGLAALGLPAVYSGALPSETVLRAHVVDATRIYGQGSFGAILAFRWRETQQLIAPLLAASAQKTLGLMLLGVAVWRWDVVREPQRRRFLLWAVCLGAGAAGLALGSHVPLALAYAAALLAWRRSAHAAALIAPVAAAGRMALTNYLAQSFLFAILFYGYGLGLFGRLATAPAAALGVAVYAGQLWFSAWWLKRYRFGPFEWFWRSLTYGRRQPMRTG